MHQLICLHFPRSSVAQRNTLLWPDAMQCVGHFNAVRWSLQCGVLAKKNSESDMTLLICLTNHHIGCAFHFSFVSTTINILLYLATSDGYVGIAFHWGFIAATEYV